MQFSHPISSMSLSGNTTRLAIGTTDGIVVVHQRRRLIPLTGEKRRSQASRSPRPGTYSFFTRGAHEKSHDPDDYLLMTQKKQKLAEYDVLLKKFRYGDALDEVLRGRQPQMMWTPTGKTRKFMTEKQMRFDDIPTPGPRFEGEGSPKDKHCLVWSGKFHHKYHGSEIPAIRSQAIINMSPENLVDLLMDSNRVSEYNKSSIGRLDEVVLSDGKHLDTCPFSGKRKKKLTGVVMDGVKIIDGTAFIDCDTDDERSDFERDEDTIHEEHIFDDNGGKSVRTFTTRGTASGNNNGRGSRNERQKCEFVGVTKLVRSKNKLPLIRKHLEFVTLLHCRALTDEQGGDGYIIVGRGITPAQDVERDSKGVMRSEILLNVHIIRRLGGKNSSSKSLLAGAGGGVGGGGGGGSSGRVASKKDLKGRSLIISVNHIKSPLIPNLIAKKVGLSAAMNFVFDIRALAGHH